MYIEACTSATFPLRLGSCIIQSRPRLNPRLNPIAPVTPKRNTVGRATPGTFHMNVVGRGRFSSGWATI